MATAARLNNEAHLACDARETALLTELADLREALRLTRADLLIAEEKMTAAQAAEQVALLQLQHERAATAVLVEQQRAAAEAFQALHTASMLHANTLAALDRHLNKQPLP